MSEKKQEKINKGVIVSPPDVARSTIDGLTTMLVRPHAFECYPGDYVLISTNKALGIVSIGDRISIDESSFAKLEPQHLITKNMREEWSTVQGSWNRNVIWGWPVSVLEKFDEPKNINADFGTEMVVDILDDIEDECIDKSVAEKEYEKEECKKYISITKDMNIGSFDIDDLKLIHKELHDRFGKKDVENWDTEDLVNAHAIVVDQIVKTFRSDHPANQVFQLDDLSNSFEFVVTNKSEDVVDFVEFVDKGNDMFENAQYLQYPDENKELNYCVHQHWIGKNVHSDLKIDGNLDGTMICWELDTQCSDIDEHVTTMKNAKCLSKRFSEISKIDWDNGNVNDKEIIAKQKPLCPSSWLNLEGKTNDPKPNEMNPVGGNEKYPGVFHIVDKGVVEYGIQTDCLHEYFFKGDVLNSRVIFKLVDPENMKAVWTRSYMNDLPDSAFLYIEPGGKKDEDGKTVPRTLRHFPVKNHKGDIDLPHLRNAIARIPQSKIPNLSANDLKRLQEKARKLLNEADKELNKSEQFVWIATFPEEQKPYALNQYDIGEYLPENVSALPANIRKQIPDEFKYWKKSESDVVRKNLFNAIYNGNIKINFSNYEKSVEKKFADGIIVSFDNIEVKKIGKEKKRLVTGVVLEPNVIDAQGDYESEEAIEKAAHKFLKAYNRPEGDGGTMLGFMHRSFGDIGLELVESWIAPIDFNLGNTKERHVKKGSWLMTVHVLSDITWNKIENGEITGFSIGGIARSTRQDG